MRRIGAIVIVVVVSAACTGTATTSDDRASSTPATTATPDATPPPTSSAAGTPSPTVSPIALPPGAPATFAQDLPADELDATVLIPRGTDVEESWVTEDPEALVIAYVERGADPFRSERGVLVWRRLPGEPPWRAVAWFPTSAGSGVLGVDGLATDVTGDGRQDVLLAAYTGGSGACARWSVIDVEAAAEAFARALCDGRIDPSVDPTGLSIDQARYRPGDPHCCPSAFVTTVLTYDGDGAWTVASRDVRDAA